MGLRLVRGGVAVAVSAVALAVAAEVSATGSSARAPITQAQSGKTFVLAKGRTATLRLSNRWVWSEPRFTTAVVDLTPVEYFVDPGFREWEITGRARGRAVIRSVGQPACSGCALAVRRFTVAIVVTK